MPRKTKVVSVYTPKCPICDMDLSNQLPEFCSQCAWDIKNDPLFSVSLDRLPEKMLNEWQQRRNIQKKLWQERQKFEDLNKEQQFWKTCQERHTLKAYEEYRQKFPNGAYFQEANRQIQSIQHQEKVADENRFWRDQCQNSGASGYQSYLRQYPNGIYANEARRFIQQFEEERRERNRIEQDLVDWRTCMNKKTISGFQDYLDRHPDGQFAFQARHMAAELIQQQTHSANLGQDKKEVKIGNTEQDLEGPIFTWLFLLLLWIVILLISAWGKNEFMVSISSLVIPVCIIFLFLSWLQSL